MNDPLVEAGKKLGTPDPRMQKALRWWFSAAVFPFVFLSVALVAGASIRTSSGSANGVLVILAMVLAELGGIGCLWRLPYPVRTRLICLCLYVPASVIALWLYAALFLFSVVFKTS